MVLLSDMKGIMLCMPVILHLKGIKLFSQEKIFSNSEQMCNTDSDTEKLL